MNTIFLIFAREFKTRIRNKTFILMSILGPVLIAGILIIPLWLEKMDKTRVKNVAVIDESHILGETIKNFENYKFTIVTNVTVEEIRKDFENSGFDAVLFIPQNIYSSNNCIIYSDVWIDNALKAYVGYALRRDLEYMALLKEKVSVETIKRVSTPVFVGVQKWSSEGNYIDEETSMAKKSTISITAVFLIYIFVFMYGVLVLRGVLEEKTGRVVEVIVSSVKPVYLMAGKIIGIGTVGLLQFIVWVILTFGIVSIAQIVLFPETYNPTPIPELTEHLDKTGVTQITAESQNFEYAVNLFQSLDGINWPVMITSFIFFFIFGYLLYASIFAGIGAVLDQDSETQQFVIPVTIPLILSLLVINSVIANPNGNLAVWMSYIPFTSPIVMLARIPFGVPYWQVSISAVILILTCVGTIMFSSKMYKSGLLLYGKKVTIFTFLRFLITKK